MNKLVGIEILKYDFEKDGQRITGEKTIFHFEKDDNNTVGVKVWSAVADKDCIYDVDMIGKNVMPLYSSIGKYSKVGKIEVI